MEFRVLPAGWLVATYMSRTPTCLPPTVFWYANPSGSSGHMAQIKTPKSTHLGFDYYGKYLRGAQADTRRLCALLSHQERVGRGFPLDDSIKLPRCPWFCYSVSTLQVGEDIATGYYASLSTSLLASLLALNVIGYKVGAVQPSTSSKAIFTCFIPPTVVLSFIDCLLDCSTMYTRPYLLSLLALVPSVLSTPAPAKRNETIIGPVTQLSTAQVDSFIPYSWFAAAAYCPQGSQATWTCGSCQAPPVKDLIVYASGGDSSVVQNWYVGWWPSGNSVIVTHQGTSLDIVPILRDADFFPVPIDRARFPGAPPLTTVHKGFHDEHELTATKILATVKQIIAERGATKVTTVGHSLGGALALLEGLYLRLNLPPNVNVVTRTFGQPRVGNDVFAQFVDLKVPDLVRITLKGDIVPVLPPLITLFRHTSGEKHQNVQNVYNDCSGRDNLDINCSTGQLLAGGINLVDHLGPYPGGVNMGPAALSPASLC